MLRYIFFTLYQIHIIYLESEDYSGSNFDKLYNENPTRLRIQG